MAITNHIQKLKPAHHDFTQNHFGHHLTILDLPNNGETLYVAGHSKNVLVGDHIAIKRGNIKCTYSITEIDYDEIIQNEWRAILQLSSMEEIS